MGSLTQNICWAGNLRDDSQPEFLQEFHKALAAVSGDLFFTRYRFESDSVHSMEDSTSSSTLSMAKGRQQHVLEDSFCINWHHKNILHL